MRIAILLLMCASVFGESKTDADLRARIAAIEARQLTAKDKAELQVALDKMNARANASAGAATASRDTISEDAAKNAANAQATADDHAEAARRAAEDAAATAKAQSDKSDRGNNSLLVMQAFGFATVLAGFIYKAIIDSRDRKERQASAAHLVKKIDENTDISVKAFDTANNINEKIASNGSGASDVARELVGLRAAVEDIRLQVDQLRAAIAGKA
jgi:hypothetical protein